jgi:Flp pilus assembly pilin Flp
MERFINDFIEDETGAVTLEYVAVAVIVGAMAVAAIPPIVSKVKIEVERFSIDTTGVTGN